MRNPFTTTAAVLGVSSANYTAAKDALRTWLEARPDQEQVSEVLARQQHALLLVPRVWNAIKAELGIFD